MNKMRRRLFFFMLVIALVAIPTVAVLAKELGSLTITGPGIKGSVTVDHQGGMRKLESTGFFAEASLIKPPENLGEGYNITAYLNLDSKMVPFVQMVYYPIEKGKPGYVHYTGRLNGESMKTVDEWSQLPPDADDAFRGLMGVYGIELQTAVLAAPAAVAPVKEAPAAVEPVAAAPSVSPVSIQPVYMVTAAAILLLIGAGLVLRRRAIHQRSS
jgi:hypothetical protein